MNFRKVPNRNESNRTGSFLFLVWGFSACGLTARCFMYSRACVHVSPAQPPNSQLPDGVRIEGLIFTDTGMIPIGLFVHSSFLTSENWIYHVLWLLSTIFLIRWLYLNEHIIINKTNNHLIGQMPNIITSHGSCQSPVIVVSVSHDSFQSPMTYAALRPRRPAQAGPARRRALRAAGAASAAGGI